MARRTAPKDPLARLRARIDAADHRIVRALADRREVVAALAAVKQREGLPLRDAARERALREERRAFGARLGVPEALVDAVFRAVLTAARAQLAEQMETTGARKGKGGKGKSARRRPGGRA
jgi:chorismate mutase